MNAALKTSRLRAVVGGGGWADNPLETLPRVERALELSGREHPNLAVFPTPLNTPTMSEIDGVRARFGGPHCQFLTASTNEQPSYDRAAGLLEWADVVLVFGGNFAELMHRWRISGIADLMIQAAEAGRIVFTGSSSGMLWLFRAGQAVCRLLPKPDDKRYRFIDATAVISAYGLAHANEIDLTGHRQEKPRLQTFHRAMRRKPIGSVGVAVSTQLALEITGGVVGLFGHDRYAWMQRIEVIEGGLSTKTYYQYDNPQIPYGELFFAAA